MNGKRIRDVARHSTHRACHLQGVTERTLEHAFVPLGTPPGGLLDYVTAIADRIVKPEMLSVLLAYDLPRCRLKIAFRPQRCGATRAFPLVIDAKQVVCDRIAGLDDLTGVALIGIGPSNHATHGDSVARTNRNLID